MIVKTVKEKEEESRVVKICTVVKARPELEMGSPTAKNQSKQPDQYVRRKPQVYYQSRS